MLFQIASPSFTAFFVSIFFSCLTLASAGSAAQAPSPADDTSRDGAALQKLVKSFEAAWNKADVESIALLFSPDGQLVTPNGSTAKTRPQIKELIAKERESRLREATIRQGVESINFIKGNTAVIKGKYAIDGVAIALGVKKSFAGPFILRVRKQNGEWSILSAQLLKS
jgi:uncharacterized protein (TIGR02246 family)